MPYELGVTEVGPAEYPLMQVLRETIFGEVGHRSMSTIAEDLEGRVDVLALMAHLEGNPVGYKIGYRFAPGMYYSKEGGVLRPYRRHGLARRMQEWQHGFAKARGYRAVFFNSFNHFRDMILFGLASGFRPVGAEWRDNGAAMSFRFLRSLTESAGPGAPAPVDVAASNLEIACDQPAQIHAAVAAGFELCGIRLGETGKPMMLLKSRTRSA